MKMKKTVLILILALSLLLTACKGQTPANSGRNEGMMTFYYTNETYTSLIPYQIAFDLSRFAQDQHKLSALIERLEMVPDSSLFPIIPSGLIVQTVLQQAVEGNTDNQQKPENENRILQIYLSDQYASMTANQKTVMRTGLMQVLFSTGLIDEIVFMVGTGDPGVYQIADEGRASDDMIVNQYGADVFNDEVKVKLYFMNADRNALVMEERSLRLGLTEQLSSAIMSALMAGPAVEGHLPTIPDGTQINEIMIENGVCYLDLSEEFRLNHEGSEILELLTIYSIVNSLSGISGLNYVQFLIDGERVEYYKSYVRLDQFIQPDMSFILTE